MMFAFTVLDARSYFELSTPSSDREIGTEIRLVVLDAQKVMVLFGTWGEKTTS